MTVVGVLTGLCAVVFPVLKFELGVGAIVTFGSLAAVVIYCVAVMFDSVRREGGRRRLDGGTLLGATIFIEATTGGAGAILEAALSQQSSSGIGFVTLMVGYMTVAGLLVAMWERAAPATAALADERQPFVFVLELTMSIFTVLTFVLSQRLDNWEFWASLAVKVGGIILIDTRLHQDLFAFLRTGRRFVKYVTSKEGADLAAKAERSLMAEQAGATVCVVVLIAEGVAVALGVADRVVLTQSARQSDVFAALVASLVAFAMLAIVAVPISDVVVRRKLARARLRKATLVALGMVLLRRRGTSRKAVKSRAVALAAQRAGMPDAPAMSDSPSHQAEDRDLRPPAGAVEAGPGAPAELETAGSWQASTAGQAAAASFVTQFWWEFALMAAFAVLASVSGAYTTRSRSSLPG